MSMIICIGSHRLSVCSRTSPRSIPWDSPAPGIVLHSPQWVGPPIPGQATAASALQALTLPADRRRLRVRVLLPRLLSVPESAAAVYPLPSSSLWMALVFCCERDSGKGQVAVCVPATVLTGLLTRTLRVTEAAPRPERRSQRRAFFFPSPDLVPLGRCLPGAGLAVPQSRMRECSCNAH